MGYSEMNHRFYFYLMLTCLYFVSAPNTYRKWIIPFISYGLFIFAGVVVDVKQHRNHHLDQKSIHRYYRSCLLRCRSRRHYVYCVAINVATRKTRDSYVYSRAILFPFKKIVTL